MITIGSFFASSVASGVRWMQMVCLVAFAVLSGCALPKSGPSSSEVRALDLKKGGVAHFVQVDEKVIDLSREPVVSMVPSEFRGQPSFNVDRIDPGDMLSLRVWENVDDGLLAVEGSRTTELLELQVDSSGEIFVPYIGRQRVAGLLVDDVREKLINEFAVRTPEPQVEISKARGDGATVALVGSVNGQGIYRLDRTSVTLLGLLATAGGVSIPTEIARAVVVRGTSKASIWVEELQQDLNLDIALRPGDKIVIEGDTRRFSALGALAQQTLQTFETRDMSLIAAIAQLGGLSAFSADPRTIFVIRDERRDIVDHVIGPGASEKSLRVVYSVDLTAGSGMFLARDFQIKDEDTIYVSDAPYAQWTKTISLLTSGLTPIANVKTLAGG